MSVCSKAHHARGCRQAREVGDGTAAVVALICNRIAYFAHAGDSRAVVINQDAAAEFERTGRRSVSFGSGVATQPFDVHCLVCRRDKIVVFATEDHKPESRSEIERIKRAGGFVTETYATRFSVTFELLFFFSW